MEFGSQNYLHNTFTLISCEAGFPNPLLAMQRYVPAVVRLIFTKFHVGRQCSTSLSLPLCNTLTQVMFGCGLPDASQNNCRLEPSETVWSVLIFVILAGTKRNVHGPEGLLLAFRLFCIIAVISKYPNTSLQRSFMKSCLT